MQGTQPTPGAPPAATDAGPRRLIRRPAQGAPVVQKKIIRRPTDQGGQTSESGDGKNETTEDEL